MRVRVLLQCSDLKRKFMINPERNLQLRGAACYRSPCGRFLTCWGFARGSCWFGLSDTNIHCLCPMWMTNTGYAKVIQPDWPAPPVPLEWLPIRSTSRTPRVTAVHIVFLDALEIPMP